MIFILGSSALFWLIIMILLHELDIKTKTTIVIIGLLVYGWGLYMATSGYRWQVDYTNKFLAENRAESREEVILIIGINAELGREKDMYRERLVECSTCKEDYYKAQIDNFLKEHKRVRRYFE